MSGVEWLVVLGGLASILWINWYFFLAEAAKTTGGGGRASASTQRSAASRDLSVEG